MDYYRPIKLLKNIWWFLIINFFWGAVASMYFNDNAFSSWQNFIYGACFGFFISATYLYGFLLIWYAMDAKYDWITQTGKRLFFGLLYGEIYAVLSFIILAFIFGYAIGGNIETSLEAIFIGWKYPAMNFFPSVLIACAFAFFKKWSQSAINHEKLKAEMMTYKFESLQNQLNPIFVELSIVFLRFKELDTVK